MEAKLSKTLMRRLPLYLDHLQQLPEDACNVSATAIARALGLGEVQVRKDLAKIAGEGRCRTGRSRDRLIRDIQACMSSGTDTASILVSAEGFGQSLLDQNRFQGSGVNILALFDLDTTRKGPIGGRPVYSVNRLESFCKYYDVSIGIIAVPPEQAQAVCDGLVACGIGAIWNCSPAPLTVPKGIQLYHNQPAQPGVCTHL